MNHIFFVWLSSKNDKAGNQLPAFDVSTNSWKIIQNIFDTVGQEWIFTTNLVSFTPLKDGKIRYPTKQEKRDWLDQLLLELQKQKPKIESPETQEKIDKVVSILEALQAKKDKPVH